MMKTQVSFLALISVMFSVIQPAWSMEERANPRPNRKRSNPQIEPDQGKN